MRTTLTIDDHLLAEAKGYAQRHGKTLTAVVQDALREILARRHQAPKKRPIKLTTFKGEGLQPGVDLDDSASLWDLMDSPGKWKPK